MKDRVIVTIFLFSITIVLTYFSFYSKEYISYFKNYEEKNEKIIIPKNKEIIEVSILGINFSDFSGSKGFSVLLNQYNIFVKESKSISESTFIYMNRSKIKDYIVEIKNEKFKFLTCFSPTTSYGGNCIFYKQKENKTNIYDEIVLKFILDNHRNLPSESTLKSNLSENNYISELNKLNIDIEKELILTEDTFYSINSVFNPKENNEKNYFYLFVHFCLCSLIILLLLSIINVHKYGNYEEKDNIVINYILLIFISVITFFTNPFAFLIFK